MSEFKMTPKDVAVTDNRLTVLETRLSEISPQELKKIAVLESQIVALQKQIDDRLEAQKQATALALTAADQTTSIAQNTADKAVARAEAAASKEYLEAQIDNLRQTLVEQISVRKDALVAVLAASEKASQKAETTMEERFRSVNAFREQLTTQAKTFLVKAEGDLRFYGIEKQLDEIAIWRREIDLKFAQYVTVSHHNQIVGEWTIWRRIVDAALTAAQSRTGLMAAMAAMAIAVLTLLIAIFNLFAKTTT